MPVSCTNGNGIITINDGNSVINAPKGICIVMAYGENVRIQFSSNSSLPTNYVQYHFQEFTNPVGGSAFAIASIVSEYIFQAIMTAVENYSALPPANTVAGKFYYCLNAQGTWWLPWTLGGTYYPAGVYYSDGVNWMTDVSPSQATQSEANAGTVGDKFVSPSTLNNYSGWNKTKVGLSNVDNTSDLNKPISNATITALNDKADEIVVVAIQAELKTAGINKYNQYIYTGALLTRINIWETDEMLTKIFQIDYEYSGATLTSQTVERISDGFSFQKSYVYDGNGVLQSVESLVI